MTVYTYASQKANMRNAYRILGGKAQGGVRRESLKHKG
jgi:hypothetical protein